MRRRLFLFFLPYIYAPISVANEALWNCSQNKDSGEWVCVGEKKSVDKADTAKPATSTAAKDVQPAPSKAIENTQPATAESGRANAAKTPANAESFAKDMPSSPAEAVEKTVAEPERIEPQISPTKNAELESGTSKPPVIIKTDKDKRQVNVESEPVDSNSQKVLQTEANRPGWTCDAKTADKSWDCKLVGADPKGQAKVIETYEPGISLLTPAFDYDEEQTLSNLKTQLKYDPWQSCTSRRGKKKPVFTAEKNLREVTPLDINSDYAEIFDNEMYSYVGNVEMTRADQHSVSHKATYDTVSETLDLQGSVYYNEDELALHSESASLNLASDQARLRDALFISPATPLRGRAKTIYRESGTLTRYKSVAYTSCRPGNQDWVVHASELKLNKVSGQGAAKNAWLEFKGTPVFYSPYMSFPMDDRRLSGFLSPSFGHTQRAGITLATPYYWNIAPNYDATISPRYLSSRGAVLGGDFRYLTEMSNGKADIEFMPNDSQLKQARYLIGIKNSTRFSPHISSSLDLNKVSDKTYFADLGNALSTSTYSSYLVSRGNLSYVNQGISLTGAATSYESIDQAITDAGLPYRTLPRVNLNLNHAFDFMPLNTVMDSEYVYFQHSTLLNGQRVNVRPSVSFPLQNSSAFIMPKFSLQNTQYALSAPQAGALSGSNSLSRTLPIFSTDTGLYLEKDVNFGNKTYLHTLEPRLFYLYVPRTDQSSIPVFDSGITDFSFNSMFLENRFSSVDRVQDANQLTTALTTRLVDNKSGVEKLKFSVGQIAYFQDRKVNLPGYQESLPGYFPDTDKFSNLVTELNTVLTDHMTLSGGTQWNPHLNRVVRHNAGLHYQSGPGEIVNLGYRYRKNIVYPDFSGLRPYDIINTDVSFHWPVYNEWSAVGRWSYSLLNKNTQESFLGVEKENCCWRFRVIARRWISGIGVNPDPNNPNAPVALNVTTLPQTGVFFQVELKGLTNIGTKLEQFFEKQIYGYQAPKDE